MQDSVISLWNLVESCARVVAPILFDFLAHSCTCGRCASELVSSFASDDTWPTPIAKSFGGQVACQGAGNVERQAWHKNSTYVPHAHHHLAPSFGDGPYGVAGTPLYVLGDLRGGGGGVVCGTCGTQQ